MVATAQCGEITWAGRPAFVIGNCMVQITFHCAAVAGGEGAGAVSGLDEAAHSGGWPVAVVSVGGVAAGVDGNGAPADLERRDRVFDPVGGFGDQEPPLRRPTLVTDLIG